MSWNESALRALRTGLKSLGLQALSAEQEERFKLFAEFLVEYNQKVNLTAIVNPEEIAIKHFVDSLTIQRVADLKPGLRLIDIGSGAGFPGVPLLILQPELQVTLLDALSKRLRFLDELLRRLGLKAHLLHARAEFAAHNESYRATYDLATARAVTNLSALLEYSVPFLKKGGCVVAQKGPSGRRELDEALYAMRLLSVTCEEQEQLRLPPAEEERLLLVFRKLQGTPPRYPREPRLIREKPL